MKNRNTLHLNQLKDLRGSLSPVQCAYYAEAAIVAFENQGHQPGVELAIKGIKQDFFQVKWEALSLSRAGWQEPRDIAENGSIAIGILLILELTEFQIVEQSVIGTGFDFWLGYKENDERYEPDNFLNARLEISGMNNGSHADMFRRARKKLKQLSLSDNLKVPGFVVVTEFSSPASIILEK